LVCARVYAARISSTVSANWYTGTPYLPAERQTCKALILFSGHSHNAFADAKDAALVCFVIAHIFHADEPRIIHIAAIRISDNRADNHGAKGPRYYYHQQHRGKKARTIRDAAKAAAVRVMPNRRHTNESTARVGPAEAVAAASPTASARRQRPLSPTVNTTLATARGFARATTASARRSIAAITPAASAAPSARTRPALRIDASRSKTLTAPNSPLSPVSPGAPAMSRSTSASARMRSTSRIPSTRAAASSALERPSTQTKHRRHASAASTSTKSSETGTVPSGRRPRSSLAVKATDLVSTVKTVTLGRATAANNASSTSLAAVISALNTVPEAETDSMVVDSSVDSDSVEAGSRPPSMLPNTLPCGLQSTAPVRDITSQSAQHASSATRDHTSVSTTGELDHLGQHTNKTKRPLPMRSTPALVPSRDETDKADETLLLSSPPMQNRSISETRTVRRMPSFVPRCEPTPPVLSPLSCVSPPASLRTRHSMSMLRQQNSMVLDPPETALTPPSALLFSTTESASAKTTIYSTSPMSIDVPSMTASPEASPPRLGMLRSLLPKRSGINALPIVRSGPSSGSEISGTSPQKFSPPPMVDFLKRLAPTRSSTLSANTQPADAAADPLRKRSRAPSISSFITLDESLDPKDALTALHAAASRSRQSVHLSSSADDDGNGRRPPNDGDDNASLTDTHSLLDSDSVVLQMIDLDQDEFPNGLDDAVLDAFDADVSCFSGVQHRTHDGGDGDNTAALESPLADQPVLGSIAI
ncbi:hypothetical protein THASP1DRAFT_21366, partial [Thamnocephalis sphaerospora]